MTPADRDELDALAVAEVVDDLAALLRVTPAEAATLERAQRELDAIVASNAERRAQSEEASR